MVSAERPPSLQVTAIAKGRIDAGTSIPDEIAQDDAPSRAREGGPGKSSPMYSSAIPSNNLERACELCGVYAKEDLPAPNLREEATQQAPSSRAIIVTANLTNELRPSCFIPPHQPHIANLRDFDARTPLRRRRRRPSASEPPRAPRLCSETLLPAPTRIPQPQPRPASTSAQTEKEPQTERKGKATYLAERDLRRPQCWLSRIVEKWKSSETAGQEKGWGMERTDGEGRAGHQHRRERGRMDGWGSARKVTHETAERQRWGIKGGDERVEAGSTRCGSRGAKGEDTHLIIYAERSISYRTNPRLAGRRRKDKKGLEGEGAERETVQRESKAQGKGCGIYPANLTSVVDDKSTRSTRQLWMSPLKLRSEIQEAGELKRGRPVAGLHQSTRQIPLANLNFESRVGLQRVSETRRKCGGKELCANVSGPFGYSGELGFGPFRPHVQIRFSNEQLTWLQLFIQCSCDQRYPHGEGILSVTVGRGYQWINHLGSSQVHENRFFLSTYMSPLATLCNLPIHTAFNGHATTSCVSLDWVNKSGLRTLDSRFSGPLTLLSDVGVISMRLNDIPVADSLSSDLLLGLDWFNFARSCAPDLVVYMDSGSINLRQPVVSVGATESGSLSCVTPAVTPVLQRGTGTDVAHPSIPPSVSLGNSDAVFAPSSMPRTRGIDVVAASHVAQTSRSRDVAPINDEIIPINNEIIPLNLLCDDDTFVYLTLTEKRTALLFLVCISGFPS
ncbi:hypothetical protein C8R47DRAFT_1066553 [Mycena vitilis]|nr:hypothetical protein C8R47DRAFT_1066553 [Mycena vitilis]